LETRQYIRILLSSIIIFIFSVQLSSAQSVTVNAMPFLMEHSSMRSKALGYATVAMSGYPGAAEINPATIGKDSVIQGSTYFLDKKRALFSRDYGYHLKLFQPNIDFKKGNFGVAAYLSYLNFGKQTLTDEKGNFISTEKSYEQSISLAGSYEITPHLSAGLGMHYLTSKLGVSNIQVGNYDSKGVHSFAIDLGLLYKRSYVLNSVILKPSFGWSLTNFGSVLHYTSIDSDPLPMEMQGGLGLLISSKDEQNQHPVFSIGLYTSLSHILARKDENGHSYGPFKSLFKGWGPYQDSIYYGQNSRVSFTDQFSTHYGIELTMLDRISLRFGYINSARHSHGYNETNYGIGLNFKYVNIDFTMSSYGNGLNTSNGLLQITLRYPLNSNLFK